MRKRLATIGAALLMSALASTAFAGLGLPSGPHYDLEIIVVPRDKQAPMDNKNGSRIFVPVEGESNIWLYEGDFAVLDANGTDEHGAAFQLPHPDEDNDGVTEYSVYARALGKPGGSATMTTCATDPESGDTYCSTGQLVLVREGGRSSFDNGSEELLYIYADTDGDGTPERYPLFDEQFEGYYWHYDNNGLKVAQLRFYDGVPTTVE